MSKIINIITGLLGIFISTKFLQIYINTKSIHHLIGTILIGIISILILAIEIQRKNLNQKIKIFKRK